MSLYATTSHTVGPYYHIGLTWLNREDLTVAATLGERVAISGQVVDGNGDVVNDAMLEVWQANAAGKYDHPEDEQDKAVDPNFEGFGRVPVDAEGRFRFTTIKPGSCAGPERHDPGAAFGGAGVCPWLGEALADADLF